MAIFGSVWRYGHLMSDSKPQTPRHPNPEIDSLLKVEALAMRRDHEKDEAFGEVVSRLDFLSRSPATASAESMPDGGSRHRDGEGEWVRYSYDRPGADQPAQTIEPIDSREDPSS